jgi:hypothetical protein
MYSGMRLELMGMSDRQSVFSALTTRFRKGTYSMKYTPDQEVGASKHHPPRYPLSRSYSGLSKKILTWASVCTVVYLSKDKPYLQRINHFESKDSDSKTTKHYILLRR